MKTLIQAAAFALALLTLSACPANECFDLVYDEPTNTCQCPPETVANYEEQACEREDGTLIPWEGLRVPYVDSGMADAGADGGITGDLGMMDMGLDRDQGPVDGGNDVVDVDAGPAPAVPIARFPANGAYTGSPHVPVLTSAMNHPLRPRFGWDEVPEADHYQVELTTECDMHSFRDCEFTDPTISETTAETRYRPETVLPVAMVAPVGSRYYWRLRACTRSRCSEWTTPRYLNIGRVHNDYNGDGYPDLAIAANRQDLPETDEGVVYVYFGRSSGLATTPGRVVNNPRDEADAQFGTALDSAGDVNADGFADLLIGDRPQGDVNTGHAFLFLGSLSGPPNTPNVTFGNPDSQPNAEFGASVAGTGDLDGDGFDDIAIGASRQDTPETDAGVVYVYRGGRTGPERMPNFTLNNPLAQEHGWFGSAMAGAGDVNGDGFQDLLVGAAAQSAPDHQEGGAYIYFGSQAGLRRVPDVSLDNPDDSPSAGFGTSLDQAGDVNGDGYSDILVGAPFRSNAEGEIWWGSAYVFLGGPDGVAPEPTASLASPLGVSFVRFGQSVSHAGDVNGDGFGDLIVGEPLYGTGHAHIYLGAADFSASPARTFANPLRTELGGFGFSVAGVGDVDADGYADVAIGAPSNTWNDDQEGTVHVNFGSTSGLRPDAGLFLDNPTDQEFGGGFGGAIAN